jgi:hypothetical protein
VVRLVIEAEQPLGACSGSTGPEKRVPGRSRTTGRMLWGYEAVRGSASFRSSTSQRSARRHCRDTRARTERMQRRCNKNGDKEAEKRCLDKRCSLLTFLESDSIHACPLHSPIATHRDLLPKPLHRRELLSNSIRPSSESVGYPVTKSSYYVATRPLPPGEAFFLRFSIPQLFCVTLQSASPITLLACIAHTHWAMQA